LAPKYDEKTAEILFSQKLSLFLSHINDGTTSDFSSYLDNEHYGTEEEANFLGQNVFIFIHFHYFGSLQIIKIFFLFKFSRWIQPR